MLPIQTLRWAKKLVATLGGKNKIYFKKSCYFSLCFLLFFVFLLIWQIICWFDKWKIWFCCCFIQNIRSLEKYTKSCSSERESAFPHWKWNFSLKSQENGCIFRPKSSLFEGVGYCIFPDDVKAAKSIAYIAEILGLWRYWYRAYGNTLSGYSLSQKSRMQVRPDRTWTRRREPTGLSRVWANALLMIINDIEGRNLLDSLIG